MLAASLPTLHQLIRIREQDIRLIPDFCLDRSDCSADVGIGLRPWDLLVIALCAIGGVLRWFLGFRKRATKTNKAVQNNVDTTAQAENAA